MENNSKGLGDSIEKLTKTTRIKSFIESINKLLGTDCNCGKRQQKLNKLFPYKQTPTEEDVDTKD